jgi:hypothetical protein
MAADNVQQGHRTHAATMAVAGLLLSPMTSQAADTGIDLDLPEVGTHLTHLPQGAARLKALDYIDRYAAVVKIGDATLTIVRAEDPVPAGASLTDAAYRSAAQSFFQALPDAHPSGQMTSVAGQPAWSQCRFTRRLTPPHAVVEYRCSTWVIANDRLYALVAYQSAADGPRPPEFDAARLAVAGIAFGPVTRPPADSAYVNLKTPVVLPSQDTAAFPLYPRAARGENGVVDVTFRLDETGRAHDVRLLYASSRHLADALPKWFEIARFRASESWKEKGLHDAFFAMEFQFSMVKAGTACEGPAEPRLPEAAVVATCGTFQR